MPFDPASLADGTASLLLPTSRAKGVGVALWEGPSANTANGGVTFSMLSKFLVCRERFRVQYVEGLRTADSFNHRIEYGNMWHVCEECHAMQENSGKGTAIQLWPAYLKEYVTGLCSRYRLQQEQVDHWYNVCKTQFVLYVDHWSKHQDVIDRTPLMQEQVFNVPYKLPSGRVVYLRGKWDSVDLIGKGKQGGVYLQENKTKGDVDEVALRRQLQYDLQSMMYLVALQLSSYKYDDRPICGVRYNVVRRPLSGGKGSIVRHKATKNQPEETKDHYYGRLAEVIKEQPDHFFMRFKVEVTATDVEKFRKDCLDPILENLCDWYDYRCNDDPTSSIRYATAAGLHFRMPYGIYSPLMDGGTTDVDEYLNTGSRIGLAKVDKLFSELQ